MKIEVDDREHATVLAALRFWQGHVDFAERKDYDIATNGGKVLPLTDDEIDVLCENVNCCEGEEKPDASERGAVQKS